MLYLSSRSRLWQLTALHFLLNSLMVAASARAASYGAVAAGGAWSSSSTWSPAGVPGVPDTVYIGSNVPAGAAATATVTLAQSQSASTVYLGYASGDGGTLSLGSFNLAVSNSLYIGNGSHSTGSIVRGTGSITAGTLYVANSNTFAFGAGNVAGEVSLSTSSLLTTSATSNVTRQVNVLSGARLVLGSDAVLSNYLNLQGPGSTLDMGGHKLTTGNYIEFAAAPGNLVNRGPLTTDYLYVSDGPFNLLPSDSVTTFYLTNVSGSTLANNSVPALVVSVSSLLTTTATNSVTGQIDVEAGSKLTLGADATLSNYLNLQDTGSTLDMGGHRLSAANYIYLGQNGGVTTLANRGPLVTPSLYVANEPFSLSFSDSVTNLYLSRVSGSTLGNNSVSYLQLSNSSLLTTTATNNVTGAIDANSGSKLSMGTNLVLSSSISPRDTGSTLDMRGNELTAADVYFGWNGGAVSITNPGPIATGNLYVANRSMVSLPANGDDIAGQLTVSNSAVLTLLQEGAMTGLSLDGDSPDSLSLTGADALDLEFEGQQGWIFRWQDDTNGGNWTSTLAGLINGGQIMVHAPSGYEIYDQSGYTYIAAVPEPRARWRCCLAAASSGFRTSADGLECIRQYVLARSRRGIDR